MENKDKIIVDLCGGTGMWSKRYTDKGYTVYNITLPKYDVNNYYIERNQIVFIDNFHKFANKKASLKININNIYGVLAAPPCDEFSYAKHFHGKGNYKHDFKKGLKVVYSCKDIIVKCKPKFWALENPAHGYLKKWLGEPNFIFNPWEFGDNYQKKTAIWGEFNPPKKSVFEKPDGIIKFSMLKSKDIFPEYYGKLTRQERRAITPQGFAKAFYEANK